MTEFWFLRDCLLLLVQAVRAANNIYMIADRHVIIFGRAMYTVFDAQGKVWSLSLTIPAELALCPLPPGHAQAALTTHDKHASQGLIYWG